MTKEGERLTYRRNELPGLLGLSLGMVDKLIKKGEIEVVRLGKSTLIPANRLHKRLKIDEPEIIISDEQEAA